MSKWVVEIDNSYDIYYEWVIFNPRHPSIAFAGNYDYTRRDSAIRGARRMAKALGIEVTIK